jgi:hypothetical protein
VKKVVHVLAFQGVWFCCVFGAAHGSSWPGVGAAVVFLALTLATSKRRGAEAGFVAQVALLGAVFDSLLTAAGVLAFSAPAPVFPDALAPLWIVALWASFATLAPRSLSWLQGKSALAAALGVLAGPVTYFSAARLGAAELLWESPQAALAVGVEYGLAMPIVMALSRRAVPDSSEGAPAQ